MTYQYKQPTTEPEVAPLLYIEASAHCDWDWLRTFDVYYTTGIGWADTSAVKDIISGALQLIQNQPGFVFAFCEVAYLRRYVEDFGPFDPTNFTISAGGFTSAENLLTHGEAFIRNYLLGRAWATATLNITPSNQMWVPDDFGHDAQLPIVLRALGFTGVGFWRVAGKGVRGTTPPPPPPPPTPSSPQTVLLNAGLDFVWTAADGSTTQGHWLKFGYGDGNGKSIADMIADAAGSPTPLLFCPMDNDFATPPGYIMQWIEQWNSSSPPPPTPAVLSTFDEYMQAVRGSGIALPGVQANPRDGSTPFLPHPYWSGAYATRPKIKRLHYSATRALLFAESMELLLELLAFRDPGRWRDVATSAKGEIAGAWDRLMPSTHHDYMPGTSDQPVYLAEQIGDSTWSLPTVNDAAMLAKQTLAVQIAGAIPLNDGAMATAAVLSACGFTRDLEIASVLGAPGGVQSSTMDGVTFDPVQTASDGSLLFFAAAPALGYRTVSLTGNAPTRTWNLQLERQPDGSYFMANDFLGAVITVDGIVDVRDYRFSPGVNLINGIANQLVWYLDDGSLYEFGLEMFDQPDSKFAPADPQPEQRNAEITVLDDGPLLKRIAVAVDVVDPNATSNTIRFTREYALQAWEPLLRMQTTGAAPSGDVANPPQGYSVMTSFPFRRAAESLTFGTPHHWDTRAPRAFYQDWPPPQMTAVTFEPSHQFVVANDGGGDPIAALYHFSTPAWGIHPDGSLINCLLRNVPKGQRIAEGSDTEAHTFSYALRVSGGLPPASTAGPLREALAYNNPLVAQIVPPSTTAELPPMMSIAATTDSTALIAAAKVGQYDDRQLVLRVYQPTNQGREIVIVLDSAFAQMVQSASAIHALETSYDGDVTAYLQGFGEVFVYTPYALATIALAPG